MDFLATDGEERHDERMEPGGGGGGGGVGVKKNYKEKKLKEKKNEKWKKNKKTLTTFYYTDQLSMIWSYYCSTKQCLAEAQTPDNKIKKHNLYRCANDPLKRRKAKRRRKRK